MSHLLSSNQSQTQIQMSGPLTPQQMPMMGQMTQSHVPIPAVGPQMTHNPSVGASVPPSGAMSLPQTQSSAPEHRYDLIARVRTLVWALKESLANLMKISAGNVQHNSQIDSGLKTSEEQIERFDKALEDFFSICNQIELHLVSDHCNYSPVIDICNSQKTIMECSIQARDGQQYLPYTVSATKTADDSANASDSTISYSQYLLTIKNQVAFAKTVHDILMEGSKRVSQNDPINTIMSALNTQPPNV